MSLLPQKDFDAIDHVDRSYISYLQKHAPASKKALPPYAAFVENRIMEDRKPLNGRLVAAGIKPRFITPTQERHIKQRTEAFFTVLPRLEAFLRSSKKAQQYFHLRKDEIKILQTDHGYPMPVPFARFDGGLTPDGFRIYEVNMNCAATPGWVEMIYDVLQGLPFWDEFQKKYEIRYHTPWIKRVYAGVMENYRAWGGKQSHPHILLLRWPGQYNQDTDRLALAFQQYGHHATVGDATQVAYKNGKVLYQGTQFELVVRWFDLDHLLYDVTEMYRDILHAYYDNVACIVNPFSSSILAHKSLLAFFSDEQFADHFSDQERQILQDMCAWTRIVEKRQTTLPDGSSGSLLGHIAEHKNFFVIKQSIGTYGKNICIGRQMNDRDWKKAIATAVKEGGWIAQEYMKLPRGQEPFVNLRGHVSARPINQDIGPYMINGTYGGCMARASYNLVTNLMQNGCFEVVGTVRKIT